MFIDYSLRRDLLKLNLFKEQFYDVLKDHFVVLFSVFSNEAENKLRLKSKLTSSCFINIVFQHEYFKRQVKKYIDFTLNRNNLHKSYLQLEIVTHRKIMGESC